MGSLRRYGRRGLTETIESFACRKWAPSDDTGELSRGGRLAEPSDKMGAGGSLLELRTTLTRFRWMMFSSLFVIYFCWPRLILIGIHGLLEKIKEVEIQNRHNIFFAEVY